MQPDLTGDFFIELEAGTFGDFFTDGAGLQPNDPKCRLVAWAWCYGQTPGVFHFTTGAAGGVSGIWQTVARAEAMSLLSVLRCMLRFGCGGRVWCDNQLVVDRMRDLQQGKFSVDVTTSDQDLWEVIAEMLTRLGTRVEVAKVYSHQQDDLLEGDLWICRGNDAADRAASRALTQLQPEVLELHHQVVDESKSIRQSHKAMIEHMVRVGFQSVMQPVETKPPERKEIVGDNEINPQVVVQKVRGSVPASFDVPQLPRWFAWFESIWDPTCPIRWVAWHELLIHFQICTEIVGFRCNYVTYGNHRQWGMIPEGDAYNFTVVSKAFAQYGSNLVKLAYPQWKARQIRPANPRFHMWCNCMPLRVSKSFQKVVEDWFVAIGTTGCFRKPSDFSDLEPAISCGPST